MEFDILSRLTGIMNFIRILFCPYSIEGREPYLCDFVEKNFNIGLYSDIYRPVSFKLCVMMKSFKLYILTSV